MNGFELYAESNGTKSYRRYDGDAVAQVVVDANNEAACIWRAYSLLRSSNSGWYRAGSPYLAFTAAERKLDAIVKGQARRKVEQAGSEYICNAGVGADGKAVHRKGCVPRAIAAWTGEEYDAVVAELQAIAEEQGGYTDFQKTGARWSLIKAFAKRRGYSLRFGKATLKATLARIADGVIFTSGHAIAVKGHRQAVSSGGRGYRRAAIMAVLVKAGAEEVKA